MKVLELYSGIGGMHLALKESGIEGIVVAAVEINNAANNVYQHNFPNTKLYNLNIEGLTEEFIRKLNIDAILMSPPCQPFSRNGLQNDIKDPRTASFLHVLELLPNLNIKRILIENVKGFEISEMRTILVDTLKKCNFDYREFILSPNQIGIPNSRHRYYCLAKKLPDKFSFEAGKLLERFPDENREKDNFCISEILEEANKESYYVMDINLLKHINILDICYEDSKRSCCFTKAYGRFLEGSGSVYTPEVENKVLKIINEACLLPENSKERLNLLQSLKLRFFTPREICRLMCFPENFSFPDTINDRKKYMLLGNSINIKVVSELIKLL